MPITLTPSTPADKPFFTRLLRPSANHADALAPVSVCRAALFASLDTFWHEPHHHAFVMCEADKPVGLILVNRVSKLHPEYQGHAVVALLVARSWRRKGIGSRAAHQLFDRFPGAWEVATTAVCVPQQAFWRSVMQRYTGGHYREVWFEHDGWRGRVNSFESVISTRAR